jgi:hypothetical protein
MVTSIYCSTVVTLILYTRWQTKSRPWVHRYLMTRFRLSLQVVYLWRHASSTAPPFILWWSNLEILFGLFHRSSPFIGELRYQAILMEHGLYIAERTQKSAYIVRCQCWNHVNLRFRLKNKAMLYRANFEVNSTEKLILKLFFCKF